MAVLILLICGAIIVHELGHFLMAKMAGLEIEEVGIFLPPRVKTLFVWKGTQFTLNLIPLGGFMKPRVDDDGVSEIYKAPPLPRLVVLSGGILMNLLAALLAFTLYFSQWGMPDRSSVIFSNVIEGSPAHRAGIQPFDKVVLVNGTRVETPQELIDIFGDHRDQEVLLTLDHDGQIKEIAVIPEWNDALKRATIGAMIVNPAVKVNAYQSFLYAVQTTADAFISVIKIPFQPLIARITGQEGGSTGRLAGIQEMYAAYDQVVKTPTMPLIVATLYFSALINISLAGFNVLPFPALDGGHIMMTLPEFFRIKIPREAISVANGVGFIALLLLGLVINLRGLVDSVRSVFGF